ncbi:MAG: hypothetical protein AAGF97_00540 [Planctomycetota bacterium]
MHRNFLLMILASLSLSGWWFTSDQRGQRRFDHGEYAAAAEQFQEPMHEGMAWYRAKDFERAARAFALAEGPDADFNRGTCQILLGQYEAAIKSFDAALEARPGWEAAEVNREIAVVRNERTQAKGGEMGDQRIGADEIVFDRQGKNQGQDTELDGQDASSVAAMQALWLRRVQTRPADFLRAKFAFQLADQDEAQP